MTVPDCVTERGNISEGKPPNNDFTSVRVHNIWAVSIFKNLSRNFAKYLRELNYIIRDKIYT